VRGSSAPRKTKARDFSIRLGGASIDWSRAEELGLAFQRERKPANPSFAALAGQQVDLFLARACTRVWVSPAGDVDTVGIGGRSST
jgi:protease-4